MKKNCGCECTPECTPVEETEKNKILEEIETGVEYGCNPSPWAPCVFPPNYNYKKEYTIKKTWLNA
jgi:hypothetical protein